MSDGIRLISTLFSLLLGFGMAQVLRGLARVWRIKAGARKANVRIGWLVPLMGLLVILDQTSFVITSAELQAHVPSNEALLPALLLTIGGYYLVSTFVVPEKPREWPDFDDYYQRVRVVVFPGMAAINLAVLGFEALMVWRGVPLPQTWGAGGSGMGFGSPVMLAAELAFFPMMAALALVRSTRIAAWLLAATNGLILVEAIWPLFADTLHPVHLPHDAAQTQGLFALLTGMSIAILLAGLARCWHIAGRGADHSRHAQVRVGPLVPLLGLLLALNQLVFYMTATQISAQIPFTYASLLAVLVVIGGYYAIASFVFPDEPRDWPNHDDYYLRVNRIVLGGMILANLAMLIAAFALLLSGGDLPNYSEGEHSMTGQVLGLILTLIHPPLMIVLFFVTSPRKNLVLLIAANVVIVSGWLTDLL